MTEEDKYTQDLQAELAASLTRAEERAATAERERDQSIAANHALRSEFSQELASYVPEAPPTDAQGNRLDPTSVDLIDDVSTAGARRWAKALIPSIRLQYITMLNDPASSFAIRLSICKRIEDIGYFTKFAEDATTDETDDLLKKLFTHISGEKLTDDREDPNVQVNAHNVDDEDRA